MRGNVAVMNITAILLFITGTQGFFFGLFGRREPREACVTQYGYCKLRCPDCTMCYDNLLKCYRGKQGTSESAEEALPQLSPCLAKLSRCKARCATCSECYAIFIECSNQLNATQRSTGSLAESLPFVSEVEQHQPPESTSSGAGTNGENGFEVGDFTDIDESLQIRLPGRIVFIIEETFSGAAIEVRIREEEFEQSLAATVVVSQNESNATALPVGGTTVSLAEETGTTPGSAAPNT
ncbi:uncharacterized protein LOC135213028 isoform X2 [Macrobrachium nipponense]|uniref:uncharacterized protein LOC135213028 isoform X2 n=1 Tax=Macrobrachium nipponense TaxID=159736 RepID=UPI0030C8106C